MTNGTWQTESMAQIPGTTSSSFTMFIDDDPTLPRLTMTNAILVPVIDSNDKIENSSPVPCQYYTVTSFCRNPKHLDLNYANQNQLYWNNANPIVSTFTIKHKPREIIHKIQTHDENSPPARVTNSAVSEGGRRLKGLIHRGINLLKNNRSSSVTSLNVEPARNIRNLIRNRVKAASIPPEVHMSCDRQSAPRDLEPRQPWATPPITRKVPVPPPRNRNLSNFRSCSLSKENLEFQSAPSPGGSFLGNSPAGQGSYQSRKPSLTEFDKEFLASQFAKKEKLRLVVQMKQAELTTLKKDVQFLQKQLEPILRIEKLKKDNERLQHQCNILTSEVDSYTDGQIPLGETSAEFYRERSPRQDMNSFLQNPALRSTGPGIPTISGSAGTPIGRLPTGSLQFPNAPARKIPPPRPPPPSSLSIPWQCIKCTFRNHPDLSLCEQCDMMRVTPTHSSSPTGSQSTPSPPYYHPLHGTTQTRPTS